MMGEARGMVPSVGGPKSRDKLYCKTGKGFTSRGPETKLDRCLGVLKGKSYRRGWIQVLEGKLGNSRRTVAV